MFFVYNDQRDTSDFTTAELLGRSFVVRVHAVAGFLMPLSLRTA